MRNLLRQHIRDADDHLQWASCRPASHGVKHFPPQREDVVRIPINNLSHFCGVNTARRPQQQFLSKVLLQTSNLCTDCGRSETQLFARAADTAGTNYGPKVEEMMIVN